MSARRDYAQHASSAKRRGIEFKLTFEEWWAIWEPQYAKRGVCVDELGMCRNRDEGPYAVGNVRLDTPKGNGADRSLVHKVKKAPAAYLTARQSRGGSTAVAADWCLRNPFAPYTEDEESD